MMVDVTTSTVIQRPVAEVAQYAGNPDHAPEWYANIKTITWETPLPMKVGSRVTFVAQFLGRSLRYTYEVVEHDPERRLVMSTAHGPFPMETIYEWHREGDGTRMVLRNRGRPKGFSKLVSPFIGVAMRRANGKDLARLKGILEAE